MGVIQQSINGAIGSVGQAAGLAKGIKQLEKQNALKKLDAESDFLKGESERNQELENLNNFKEKSNIEADKAAEEAKTKQDTADTLAGVFLPDDKEGQTLIREAQEKAKLAQAMAKAKQKEKLNNYRYVRERQQYLEKQSQIAEERAMVYGLNVNELKGGKK